MKRNILILFILLFIVCGCTSKREKKFIEYATYYYNNYAVKTVDEFVVTLGELKELNKKEITNYDLEDFAKCDDKSEIVFKIENEKIIDNEISLICTNL